MTSKQKIYNGKRTVSLINDVGKTGQHMQRMKVDHYLI